MLMSYNYHFLSQETIPVTKQLSCQNLEKKSRVLERNPQQLFQNTNLEKHADQMSHPKRVPQVGNSASYRVLHSGNHSIHAQNRTDKAARYRILFREAH